MSKNEYIGKKVLVEVTNINSRRLKCSIGDRFEGVHSEKVDWSVGCHYVELSNSDANLVGENFLAVGWSCKVLNLVLGEK